MLGRIIFGIVSNLPESQECCAEPLSSPFRESEIQMVLPVLSIAQSSCHIPGVSMVNKTVAEKSLVAANSQIFHSLPQMNC